MKSKRKTMIIPGIITAALLFGTLGTAIASSTDKDIQPALASADDVVVTTDFGYDAVNGSFGYYDSSTKIRYFAPGSNTNTNLHNISLGFKQGDVIDNNILIEYDGGNASWAPSNLIRDYSSGDYLQMRYPGSVDGDGGSISIKPKDVRYKIKSITMNLHSRCFTSAESGTSYNHIVVNGEGTYKTISELGLSSTNLSYTWENTTTGIDSFFFSISLKQPTVEKTEKVIIVSSFSVTYSVRNDVSVVTFNTQGGSSIDPVYVINGNKVERPAEDPVKETVGSTHYIFDGWYVAADGDTEFNFNSLISQDTEIFAHWNETSADVFTMSFESNGGTSVSNIQTVEGTPFTQPDNPTRASSDADKYVFTFAGWYVDSTLKTAYDWTTLADGDKTLYAKWSFSTINDIPDGRTHYTTKTNDTSWASTDNFANDTWYPDVTLNSRDTFDVDAAKEPITMHIYSSANYGFRVHKVHSHLVRNCEVTLTIPDESKVFTFIRFDFVFWSDASYNIVLYANDSNTPVDMTTTPTRDAETTHYVQASFSESDNVKSLRMTIPNTYLNINDFYLMFGENSIHSSAVQYAENFNDAHVCGLTDNSGFDSNAWGEQETAYNALDNDVKEYLTYFTGADTEIVECLERYDRVVYLYGETYDFMGRIDAGKVTPKLNYNVVSQIASSDTTTVLFISTIFMSICAVSVIVITKKKRMNGGF